MAELTPYEKYLERLEEERKSRLEQFKGQPLDKFTEYVEGLSPTQEKTTVNKSYGDYRGGGYGSYGGGSATSNRTEDEYAKMQQDYFKAMEDYLGKPQDLSTAASAMRGSENARVGEMMGRSGLGSRNPASLMYGRMLNQSNTANIANMQNTAEENKLSMYRQFWNELLANKSATSSSIFGGL